jgi:hypothetical protein
LCLVIKKKKNYLLKKTENLFLCGSYYLRVKIGIIKKIIPKICIHFIYSNRYF